MSGGRRVTARLTHAQARALIRLVDVHDAADTTDGPREAGVYRRAAAAIEAALATQEERRRIRGLLAEAEARARREGLTRGTPPWLVRGPDGMPF